MKPLSIAVAGAGIGGLAVAAGLAQDGHRVRLFDRFDRPEPVGSGLVIQPVGQVVLAELGALPAAKTYGNPISRMMGRDAESGRPVLDVSYAPRKGLAIHRAALFEVLLETATSAGVALEAGHEAAEIRGQYLRFAGAAPAGPFDLIIDACGAASPLSPLVSKPLPYGALWANVDWPKGTDLPLDQLRQVYRRADRMMGVLPIGREPGRDTLRTAIFWSLPRAGLTDWRKNGQQAWRDEALSLWPEFAPFADQITDPAQMVMARYSHGTLRHVTQPGIAHIGDAAHRASPQLGQGANMALLDALALRRAVKHADGHIPVALQWYSESRKRHVQIYQLFSRVFTPQYQSDSTVLPWLRDRVLFPLSQMPPLPRVLTRLVCGDLLPPLSTLDKQSFRRFKG